MLFDSAHAVAVSQARMVSREGNDDDGPPHPAATTAKAKASPSARTAPIRRRRPVSD
jgi:hypothetical protein